MAICGLALNSSCMWTDATETLFKTSGMDMGPSAVVFAPILTSRPRGETQRVTSTAVPLPASRPIRTSTPRPCVRRRTLLASVPSPAEKMSASGMLSLFCNSFLPLCELVVTRTEAPNFIASCTASCPTHPDPWWTKSVSPCSKCDSIQKHVSIFNHLLVTAVQRVYI